MRDAAESASASGEMKVAEWCLLVLSSVLCDREGRLRTGPLFLLLFCLVLVLFLFFPFLADA
jgi:hypothetical protein